MNYSFTETSAGTLTLHRPGQDDLADVRVRRSFPWSKGDQFLSVRDSTGKEVVLIEDMSQLAPDQRDIVQRWMRKSSFIPVITAIESVNVDFGYQEWTVQTNAGHLCFRVQEREDLRFLPDGRFSIKDVSGNVYVLPAVETLDAKSRRAVEMLL